jgi:hypothetical protein
MWHAWERGELFRVLWLGDPKGRDQWEYLCVGRPITLKWTVMVIRIDGANWIRLVQDRVQWRAFVSTVMNLRFP